MTMTTPAAARREAAMLSNRLLFCALLCACFLVACADDETTDDEFRNGDAAYLVIGGGFSETLSVLRVAPGPSFELFADVAPTGSAINHTVYRDGNFFAVCSLSNSVVVYDRDLNVEREASVGAGTNPMHLTFADDKTAWVTDLVANDVRLLDLAPGVDADERVLAVVEMPAGDDLPRDADVAQSWARPGGAASVGGRLFVALAHLSGEFIAGGPGLIAVIDESARELETTIELEGRDTVQVVYDETRGVLWAVSAGDFATGAGFVGNGMLEALDPETLQVVERIDIDGAPYEMLLGEKSTAYLGNGGDGRLLVVDLDDGAQLDSIDLRRHEGEAGLSFVSALARDPAGFVYAAEFNSDYLYVLDPARDHEIVAEFAVNDGPDTVTFIP